MSASLVAVQSLYNRGYISKEAGIRMLDQREKLICGAITEMTKMAAKVPGIPLRDPLIAKNLTAGMSEGPLKRFGKAMVDQSDWPVWLARMAKLLGVGAGLSAGATGVHAVGQAIGGIKTKRDLEQSKKQVLEIMMAGKNVTPDSKTLYENTFNTVAQFAPTLASNPIVALGLVQGLAPSRRPESPTMPYIEQKTIGDLANAEALVQKSKAGDWSGYHGTIMPSFASKNMYMDLPESRSPLGSAATTAAS